MDTKAIIGGRGGRLLVFKAGCALDSATRAERFSRESVERNARNSCLEKTMGNWTREMWNKDLVFEVLIRIHVGASQGEAIAEIMGRPPEYEDIRPFDDKVALMYNGWVKTNGNIRRMGRKV